MIRDVELSDATAIADIYNYYILNTSITFEESKIETAEICSRIGEATEQSLPYIICEDKNGHVIGYAYASKWKGRCAYRYSVEISVYLHPEKTGHGAGTTLYTELLKQLSDLGYHAVIGGISLPNPASIALHEKFGMTKVAHFNEIGFKFGNWVDVGYWQGLLTSPTSKV